MKSEKKKDLSINLCDLRICLFDFVYIVLKFVLIVAWNANKCVKSETLVRSPSCDQVSWETCDLQESHNTNQRRNNQSPHPQICINNVAINICICLDLWQYSHLRQEHLSLFPIFWFVNIVKSIKCDLWCSAINIEHPSVAV